LEQAPRLARALAFPAGGRTLRLAHVSVADEGRYTCVVTSAAGEARRDFHLAVVGKYLVISLTVGEGGLLYTLLVF